MSGDDKTSTARPTREDIEAATKMAHVAMERAVMACIEAGAGPRSLIATVAMWEPVICGLDYALDCLTAEQESEDVPQVEPPEDASGDGWGPWIDWAGGECPVADGVEVECVARDGEEFLKHRSSGFYWGHPGGSSDIVRYRVRLPNPAEPANPDDDCHCWSCKSEEDRVTTWTSCPTCRNKRCPKATHHDNACTDSNESGQPGSRYGGLPAEPAPESDAAFLARHGVGEWEASILDDGSRYRPWKPEWCAITSDGYVYPKDHMAAHLDHPPGDTRTPEGRAALDARLVAHLRAEGLT